MRKILIIIILFTISCNDNEENMDDYSFKRPTELVYKNVLPEKKYDIIYDSNFLKLKSFDETILIKFRSALSVQLDEILITNSLTGLTKVKHEFVYEYDEQFDFERVNVNTYYTDDLIFTGKTVKEIGLNYINGIVQETKFIKEYNENLELINSYFMNESLNQWENDRGFSDFKLTIKLLKSIVVIPLNSNSIFPNLGLINRYKNSGIELLLMDSLIDSITIENLRGTTETYNYDYLGKLKVSEVKLNNEQILEIK